jgi:hypothetical protein
MTSTSSPAQVARNGSCAMDCNQEISSSFGKLTHLGGARVNFGFVSEDRFDEVTRYFPPPSNQETFHVIYYEADAPSSKGSGQA